MEPPPPGQNGRKMRRFIPWPLFPDMLQEVSKSAFRLKMWYMHSKLIGDVCDRLDIRFVSVPEQVANAGGYLKDDYFHDGIHANQQYGELIIRQMEAMA